MNLYEIKIDSRGSGWTDKKITQGTATEEDGAVRISYKIDCDDCTLFVDGKRAVQERRGSQPIKITFEEGNKTECRIGDGGLVGSFEVFTKSFKFISGKGGYFLSLEYINGSDEELIKLNFTAIKKF